MSGPTVLLFDIDGTLVTTGGAGRRALERAFAECHGRADACQHFRFDGMTDRAIIREGLKGLGLDQEAPAIDAVIAVYLRLLGEEVEQTAPERYRVHRGMSDALDAVGARRNTAVGLGTGNVREGARLKLSRVGLYERFAFGGFGCDAEDRTEFLRMGAERGAARLGVALEDCRVVVIGDTPKDVSAARALGAECVGVGTGSFTPEQLTACGATAAFRDLLEPGAIPLLVGLAE